MAKNKQIILYGIALAFLVILLKWLETRFIIIDNQVELYAGLIAVIFTGLGIWLASLIASTMYVLVWMIDYYYFIPDYLDKYFAHQVAKMKADGATAAAIQKATADGQSFSKMYKNPLVNAMYTYGEILPVGLIVTLICAFVLKRKQNAEKVVLAN